MDYQHINNFLSKFKVLLSKGEETNKAIVEIINQTVHKNEGPLLTNKSIKIQGTTIHIQGSPMLRSEILIHKEGILSNLAKILPGSRYTDIR
jgi:hypothetical protein